MATTDTEASEASEASTVSEAHEKMLVDRLARVEGQVRAIQRMITRGDGCEAVVQQIAAARGGLDKAFVEMIACALEHRLMGRQGDEPSLREELTEVVSLLSKYS